MKVQANAKINLTLDVVRKREDGYHELDMIMLPLSLCDTLDVSLAHKDEIVCGTSEFPLDETNTIYKAILLMRKHFNIKECFRVEVTKRIPMQAGLAGGSANGAAMLKAIIALCKLEVDEKTLIQIAKQIGADVPFCVVNKPSRVKGIGEKVTTFSYDCPFYLMLVKPKEGVSTGLAFSKIAFESCTHPNVDECQQSLLNNDYNKLCNCIGNTLEQSAMSITPIIKEIKEKLIIDGFDSVLMSGSGSTVFAMTRDQSLLRRNLVNYEREYHFVCECEVLV